MYDTLGLAFTGIAYSLHSYNSVLWSPRANQCVCSDKPALEKSRSVHEVTAVTSSMPNTYPNVYAGGVRPYGSSVFEYSKIMKHHTSNIPGINLATFSCHEQDNFRWLGLKETEYFWYSKATIPAFLFDLEKGTDVIAVQLPCKLLFTQLP